jgi:RNA polymerase sigma-70 factor (ECF subfamily)
MESISISDLKSGNREAFARLVDEMSGKIYQTVLRILGNTQDAEDVLQKTYINAYRSLADFEERSSLATCLYRIAVNEALMLVRKRKPGTMSVEEGLKDSDSSDDLDRDSLEITDRCCLPEGELLSEEARRFMDQAIQKLPPNLRVVFVMRDLEGLTILDTAEALSLTENNVKTRLLRARMRLRQELTVYFSGKIQEEWRR